MDVDVGRRSMADIQVAAKGMAERVLIRFVARGENGCLRRNGCAGSTGHGNPRRPSCLRKGSRLVFVTRFRGTPGASAARPPFTGGDPEANYFVLGFLTLSAIAAFSHRAVALSD